MSERIHIGSTEEFEEREPKSVEANGVEICVVRADGEFYALGNRCPHKGGPLHLGEVFPEVSEDFENARSGERPELIYTDDEVIVCPWHGWEYDIETGEHAGDPDYGVPSYDVQVEDGDVYIVP